MTIIITLPALPHNREQNSKIRQKTPHSPSCYEQIQLHADTLGDVPKYIKESDMCSILLLEDTPLVVEPPLTVELAVKQTDPGLRGDTAQGGSKPATMESGLVVQVPLFIEEGQVIKIDSRTGKYLGRV